MTRFGLKMAHKWLKSRRSEFAGRKQTLPRSAPSGPISVLSFSLSLSLSLSFSLSHSLSHSISLSSPPTGSSDDLCHSTRLRHRVTYHTGELRRPATTSPTPTSTQAAEAPNAPTVEDINPSVGANPPTSPTPTGKHRTRRSRRGRGTSPTPWTTTETPA